MTFLTSCRSNSKSSCTPFSTRISSSTRGWLDFQPVVYLQNSGGISHPCCYLPRAIWRPWKWVMTSWRWNMVYKKGRLTWQSRGSCRVGRAFVPWVPAKTRLSLRQDQKRRQDLAAQAEPSWQVPPQTETSLELECQLIQIMYDLICTINGTEEYMVEV